VAAYVVVDVVVKDPVRCDEDPSACGITETRHALRICKNSLVNCESTIEMRKRHRSGLIASHSMDTTTWGSRCSAKVKIGARCPIE
jgi:hypothetical protein